MAAQGSSVVLNERGVAPASDAQATTSSGASLRDNDIPRRYPRRTHQHLAVGRTQLYADRLFGGAHAHADSGFGFPESPEDAGGPIVRSLAGDSHVRLGLPGVTPPPVGFHG